MSVRLGGITAMARSIPLSLFSPRPPPQRFPLGYRHQLPVVSLPIVDEFSNESRSSQAVVRENQVAQWDITLSSSKTSLMSIRSLS
jgi:hypothetical protein